LEASPPLFPVCVYSNPHVYAIFGPQARILNTPNSSADEPLCCDAAGKAYCCKPSHLSQPTRFDSAAQEYFALGSLNKGCERRVVHARVDGFFIYAMPGRSFSALRKYVSPGERSSKL
jgi:hypothetical protein